MSEKRSILDQMVEAFQLGFEIGRQKHRVRLAELQAQEAEAKARQANANASEVPPKASTDLN